MKFGAIFSRSPCFLLSTTTRSDARVRTCLAVLRLVSNQTDTLMGVAIIEFMLLMLRGLLMLMLGLHGLRLRGLHGLHGRLLLLLLLLHGLLLLLLLLLLKVLLLWIL